MPKSVSFTVPSGITRMFAGLTSRWTTPASCAAPSASAAWPMIARDPLRLQRPLALHQRGQWFARHELHDEVGEVVVLAVVEDGRDVRVAEVRRVQGLAAEATREDLLVVGAGSQHLDGHRPREHGVVGRPDVAHASGRDARGQRVAITEDQALLQPVHHAVARAHGRKHRCGDRPSPTGADLRASARRPGDVSSRSLGLRGCSEGSGSSSYVGGCPASRPCRPSVTPRHVPVLGSRNPRRGLEPEAASLGDPLGALLLGLVGAAGVARSSAGGVCSARMPACSSRARSTLGVDLGPDEQREVGEPQPQQEDDDAADRAVERVVPLKLLT